jgi:hypothetical protein
VVESLDVSPGILVATSAGLFSFDGSGNAGPVHLEGRAVSAVVRDGDALWGIVDGSEIWRAEDGGTWNLAGALDAGLRATCIAPTDRILVGSSEARLFEMADAGVHAIAAFDDAPGRETWHTPWGGPPDTRSIAEWDEAAYVNVHVGGILRTEDAGASWVPTIDIDADVHQVTTAEGLVLAACAGGLAVSGDRGGNWTMRTDGLETRYSRAVAVCGDAVLLSSSNGPRGGRAAVYRGALAGGPLERCRGEIPQWFDDNIDTHCLDSLPDGTWAAFGTADGRLFSSRDEGESWQAFASDLPPIACVLVLP